jgi:hypothetical protein
MKILFVQCPKIGTILYDIKIKKIRNKMRQLFSKIKKENGTMLLAPFSQQWKLSGLNTAGRTIWFVQQIHRHLLSFGS